MNRSAQAETERRDRAAARDPIWASGIEAALRELRSGPDGLSGDEAERRLDLHGPNELEQEAGVRPNALLLKRVEGELAAGEA